MASCDLSSLLGENLIRGVGAEKVDVNSLLGDGKVIGFYFSAHWCPPCKAFTPILAEFYNNFKKGEHGDKLEIIFVSSDKTDESFDEYFKEMPWLALPYKERAKTDALRKKFKVQGIPHLAFMDAKTGKVIRNDGRSVVSDDPDGKEFPWTPKSFSEIIEGPLLSNDGAEVAASELQGKIKGLYFSAHWCPPCKAFTPALAETYKKIRDSGKEFELIFVSSDRTEESFKQYFGTMPWLSLPYKDPRIQKLNTHFSIEGIPTLMIVDENGKLITASGRGSVQSDPEGKEFPWYPKPLNELTSSSVNAVNNGACLILFTDGEEGEMEKAKVALKESADTYHSKGEDQNIFFFYGGEDDIVDSVRDFIDIPEECKLVIIDIPEKEIYTSEQKENFTDEDIKDFVGKWERNELTPTELRH